MASKPPTLSRREMLLALSALPYTLAAAEAPRQTGLNLRPLRDRFKGDLIVPGDALYENARLTNNRAFDRHPVLIARCADADDVARAMEFARSRSLPLAVRSGGHCQAGRSSCDGGVVIDLSQMEDISIDAAGGRVACGPGLRVYQANQATVEYDLALPLGVCGDVGVAGLTLGGGYGYLLGVAGLACDSLIGARVVLADGRIKYVTEESDQDLMWALRGGGANFGIVTEFHFNAHRVGQIFGGILSFPEAAAHDVAALANDCAASLPDELSMFTGIMTLPDGTTHPETSLCWSGEVGKGRQVIDDLISSKIKPSEVKLKAMSIAELVGRGDGTDGPSCVRYGEVSGKLPPEGLAALLDSGNPPAIGRDVTIDALHGAATRRNPSASAAPPISQASAPGFWFSGTIKKPPRPPSNGPREPGRAYSKLKSKYDPTNLFRMNQNIKPA